MGDVVVTGYSMAYGRESRKYPLALSQGSYIIELMTTQHWSGGEWAFDDECDCPYCETWRDNHCPKCKNLWAWDGDSEQSRVCASCRADEADLYTDEGYKPGHSSDLAF